MTKNTNITYDFVASQNGENYNQEDNRTFTGELLGETPYSDLIRHMSLIKNGGSASTLITTIQGSFFGRGSVELNNKAADKVFHFPKASDFNLKVIKMKDVKLETLYPASMIYRYSLKRDFDYSQKTPVFVDVKRNLFFIVMDERFLKDLTADEILHEKIKNVSIYNSKDKKTNYLAITGHSYDELMSNLTEVDKSYDKLKSIYKRHFLNLQESKRVIVLKYKTENEETIERKHLSQFTIPNFSDNESVANLVMRQNMELEIFQAAQIENLFYLMDEEGIINSKAIIIYDEKETDAIGFKNSCERNKMYYKNMGNTYLIMDYTEEDWLFIKNLQQKMHQLCKDLESFFLSTKTEIGISDKSFKDANVSGLENYLIEKK